MKKCKEAVIRVYKWEILYNVRSFDNKQLVIKLRQFTPEELNSVLRKKLK